MSKETAFNTIDFLAEQCNGRCVATFFGGEPLLERELLKEVVLYSQKMYGNKIDFRVNNCCSNNCITSFWWNKNPTTYAWIRQRNE